MPTQVNPIPEGFSTLTPHMVIRNASDAIEFYKKAFAAEEIMRMPGPDGNGIMHAEIKIGNSMIMIVDEMPGMKKCVSPDKLGGTTIGITIYCEDTDALYQRAIDAGATEMMKPMDMFWGDRYSKVSDPFGHVWEICTHIEDVSPEECTKRAKDWFANMEHHGECSS